MKAHYRNCGNIKTTEKQVKVASDISWILEQNYYPVVLIVGATGSGKSRLLEQLTPNSIYDCLGQVPINDDFFESDLFSIDAYHSDTFISRIMRKLFEQRQRNLKPFIITAQTYFDIKDLVELDTCPKNWLIIDLNEPFQIEYEPYSMSNLFSDVITI